MTSKLAISALALVAFGSPLHAQQRNLSAHPREGELAALAFDHGSSDLPAGGAEKLGEVAGWALNNPGGTVIVDSHGDRGEPHDEAVALALDRGQTVRDRLVGAGVDRDQIVIAAYPGGAYAHTVVSGTHQDAATIVATRRAASSIVLQSQPSVVAGR